MKRQDVDQQCPVTDAQRFTRGQDCPVCGGVKEDPQGEGRRCYGFIHAKGAFCYCTREQYAKDIPQNDDGTYTHRLRPRNQPCACGVTHPTPAWWANQVRRTDFKICDAANEIRATHIRYDYPSGKKDFTWPPGSPRPATLPLYGTERLASVARGSTVVVVEGEKKVDMLLARNIAAVSTITGAPMTHDVDAFKDLVDFEVVLWGDPDEKGRTQQTANGDRLRAIGHPNVREIRDAPAPDDFFKTGSMEQAMVLLDQAVPIGSTTGGDDDAFESLVEFLTANDPETIDLFPGLIPLGVQALIHGEPRARKSLGAFEFALSGATGTAPFGLERFRPRAPFPVLYVQEEDARSLTRRRLRRLVRERCGDEIPANLHLAVRKGINLDEPVWVERIVQRIEKLGAKLVVLDAMRRLSAKTDEGPQKVRELTAVLRSIITRTGCSIIVVHHDVKPARDGQDNQRSRSHRASGGDWFAASECPIHFERLNERESLVFPTEYKFGEDPAPFTFTCLLVLELDGTVLIRKLDGKDTSTQDAKQAGVRGRLVEWLTANGPASRTAMKKGGFSFETVSTLVDTLVRDGVIDATPGRTKDSWLYFVRNADPSSTTQDGSRGGRKNA